MKPDEDLKSILQRIMDQRIIEEARATDAFLKAFLSETGLYPTESEMVIQPNYFTAEGTFISFRRKSTRLDQYDGFEDWGSY